MVWKLLLECNQGNDKNDYSNVKIFKKLTTVNLGVIEKCFLKYTWP